MNERVAASRAFSNAAYFAMFVAAADSAEMVLVALAHLAKLQEMYIV
jgi:hypothetical protein